MEEQQKKHIPKTMGFSYYLEKKSTMMLRDLASFLCHSVDLPPVLHETAEVLKNVTRADGVLLFLVDKKSNEIYLNKKKSNNSSTSRSRWAIKEGSTVSAFVAKKREYVMVDDVSTDTRFKQSSRMPNAKAILCVPVVTQDGDCFAVIELYKGPEGEPFLQVDLKIVIVVTGWMGAAIHQNQQRIALQKQQELNEYLLDLTKRYFGDNSKIDNMITDIIKFAKHTLSAERGSFFIIDKESDELIADLFDEGIEDDTVMHRKNTKIKFGKERGIAGLVARTGNTINVKDAYNDPRFNNEVDLKTGFVTKAILCMPIMGVDGILGVVQLVNKKNGKYFTQSDENLFKTFSVYCALALRYTQVNTEMERVLHLNKIYCRMLQRQLNPCVHDLRKFVKRQDNPVPENFDSFAYYMSMEEHDDMPNYCFYMFMKIGGTDVFNSDLTKKFILKIRRLYRDNPYHNFDHAFCVAHSMYNILWRNARIMTKIEMKSLIVAALCHDVDHPGFTNTFLQVIKDDLSKLYDESVLENHHFFVTMEVLEGCKIFINVSRDEYRQITKEIKDAIIATDLMLHFKVRARLIQLWHESIFSWFNPTHRTLVKAVMMTSCDVSGQCKPFKIAKSITESLYREFYHQGDIEKNINLTPLSIMDREKQQMIPEDQVQFLAVVVIPCVNILKTVLPNTADMYNEAMKLRNVWQEIITVRGKKLFNKNKGN